MSVHERASYRDGYERGCREGQIASLGRRKEADAALVEAAGCLCAALWEFGGFQGSPKKQTVGQVFRVDAHDPRCPIALAAAIREQL